MSSLAIKISLAAALSVAAVNAEADALDDVSFAPHAPHISARELYDEARDFRYLWMDVKQEAFDMNSALVEIASAFNLIGSGAPFYNQVLVNIDATSLKGSGPQLFLQAVPRRPDGRALDVADVLHFARFNGVSANAAGELMAWCDQTGWKLSEDSDEWCAAALPRFCRSEYRDDRCPIMPR